MILDAVWGASAYLGACLAIWLWQDHVLPAVRGRWDVHWWRFRARAVELRRTPRAPARPAGRLTDLPAPSSRGGAHPGASPRPPAPAGIAETPGAVPAGPTSVDAVLSPPSAASTGLHCHG